jgi:serine/threonine protein phosphatase PrpC
MNFLQWILGKEQPEKEASLSAEALPAQGPTVVGGGLWVGKDSHIGLVRERNEDSLFTIESAFQRDGELFAFGLFIVADGMGGHQRGEVASAIATRVAAESVLRSVYLPYLSHEDQDATIPPINEVLIEAVGAANSAVHNAVPDAGTTLTMALVMGQSVYIAHVGDSRAYTFNHGSLKQITQDHSLLARLIELGQVSHEDALSHPQRNVLYRAVGQAGNLEVDIYRQSLPVGSYLLLCSDGLWGMVPESEISEIIESSVHPQEACQRLIEAANRRGGDDNVTAILVQIGESPWPRL